jgi:hypothetical protein
VFVTYFLTRALYHDYMTNVMDSAADETRVAISSFRPVFTGYSAGIVGAEDFSGKVWAARYHTEKLGEALATGHEWNTAYHLGALLRVTEGW